MEKFTTLNEKMNARLPMIGEGFASIDFHKIAVEEVVPSKEQESKVVTLTHSGTTIITPDSGYTSVKNVSVTPVLQVQDFFVQPITELIDETEKKLKNQIITTNTVPIGCVGFDTFTLYNWLQTPALLIVSGESVSLSSELNITQSQEQEKSYKHGTVVEFSGSTIIPHVAEFSLEINGATKTNKFIYFQDSTKTTWSRVDSGSTIGTWTKL